MVFLPRSTFIAFTWENLVYISVRAAIMPVPTTPGFPAMAPASMVISDSRVAFLTCALCCAWFTPFSSMVNTTQYFPPMMAVYRKYPATTRA